MTTVSREREVSTNPYRDRKLVCEKYEKIQKGFFFRKKTIRLSQQELDELSREYTLKLIAASKLPHNSTYASFLLVREVGAMKGAVWSLRSVNGTSRVPIEYTNIATPRVLIDY